MEGFGTVKEVLSGDTVVVMGASKSGPPPELKLTLASLQAPRIGFRKDRPDEPFAFASREFLRRLVIGKRVKFRVEYSVESISKNFHQI